MIRLHEAILIIFGNQLSQTGIVRCEHRCNESVQYCRHRCSEGIVPEVRERKQFAEQDFIRLHQNR